MNRYSKKSIIKTKKPKSHLSQTFFMINSDTVYASTPTNQRTYTTCIIGLDQISEYLSSNRQAKLTNEEIAKLTMDKETWFKGVFYFGKDSEREHSQLFKKKRKK